MKINVLAFGKEQGPGLLVVLAIALISVWLADFLGTSVMGFAKSPISAVMVAMLIGLVLRNTLSLPKILGHGIKFSTKRLLRVGIILLGLRLSLVEMALVVRTGFPVILVCVLVGLFLPHLINKWLKLPTELVTLISVGTSICGVSAIIATSESIGAKKEHTAYAIATITLFGLLATILYPAVAWFVFKGDSFAVGMFFGTAIHDTSQVTGAAFLYQDYFNDTEVVQVATVAKLMRNFLMVAVIPGVTVWLASLRRRQGEVAETQVKKSSIASMIPYFVLGFVAMSVVRSIGDQLFMVQGSQWFSFGASQWDSIIKFGLSISSWCITMALAAVGLGTSIVVFKGLGLRPFALGLFSALAVGLTAIVML